MADERPPAWTRSDGQIGQVPLALSHDIDSAGVHPASGQDARALAAGIIRQNQPAIDRFVAIQRQQIMLGNLDVHRAALPLQGMEVYYRHVQGLEQMHYHISPQAEARLPPPEELEAPKIPVVPEVEVPKIPEEEEPKKLGSPDFLTVDMMVGLAVEFGDGAGPPPNPRPHAHR